MTNRSYAATSVLIRFFLALAPVIACAQTEVPQYLGLRLDSASLSAGYFSSGLPTNLQLRQATYGNLLNADGVFEGSITLRAHSYGHRTSYRFEYTPSYVRRLHYVEWNAFNHDLDFTASRDLTERLHASFSVSGIVRTLDQFTSAPAVYSRVAASPLSFEDFASAVASGTYNNDQIAALLTGDRYLVSPAEVAIFGNRTARFLAANRYTYALSPRSSVSFGLVGSRVQFLPQLPENSERRDFLVHHSTSAGVNAGFSTTIAPRTELAFEASAVETFSIQSNVVETAYLQLNRVFGTHWLVHVKGGGGYVRPVKEELFPTRRGLRYLAGGGVAYKTYSNAIVLSVERGINDQYGIGAGDNLISSLGWSIHQPGSSWSFLIDGGYEYIKRPQFLNVQGWTLRGGISRYITRNLSWSSEYSYLVARTAYADQRLNLGRNTARLALIWNALPNSPYYGAR